MSDDFDQAQERLAKATEGPEGGSRSKRIAIVIAIMAALLALNEFAEKDAQTSYLSNQIAASDIWTQYQAKSVRRAVLTVEAETLASLPMASDPAIQTRITDARARAEHMRTDPGADGMEQLSQRAHAQEHERDHEMHRKNMLEIASGGLQIAIVLASISVVIDVPLFMIAGVLLALASAICGAVAEFSLL